MQEYTSADTSINSSRLPKLYTAMQGELFGKSVIDYGCGKFLDSYKERVNFNLSGYDPYNYNRPENLQKSYDIAICSNVLNVIKEQEIRTKVLETLKGLAPICMITVYEGDGSGIGKATKKDCYQLNRKAKEYKPELESVFESVTYRKGCFICR